MLSDLRPKGQLDSLKDEELPEECENSLEKRQAYLDEIEKKATPMRRRDLSRVADDFTKKKLEEEGKKAKEGLTRGGRATESRPKSGH